MTSYIPTEIRRTVEARGAGVCEYCQIKEVDTFLGFQIDHVVSEKHGGQTIESNLAVCCACCNRFKGTDVGSIDQATGEFSRFFNPRVDVWSDHFKWNGFQIESLTPIGLATVTILKFNLPERILEREANRC